MGIEMGIGDPVAAVDAAGCDQLTRAAILRGNAAHLFAGVRAEVR